MKITKKVQTLAVFTAFTMSANAAITYIDAIPGSTVEYNNGGTWDGGSAWQTGATNSTDNLWQSRTTGPAANASGGTAYITNHASEDSPALRMIVSGLDAGATYQFYFYGVNAGGSDIVQAAVSSDIGSTAAIPSLTTYNGGTNVLADGTEGNVGSGDQRRRHTLTTVTGSTSYAVYIDDFAVAAAGDRVTVDGIGFEAIPEPSSTALLGLGGLALILRRRK